MALFWLTALASTTAAPPPVPAPPVPAATAPRQTIQQQFDAASEAAATGRCATAVPLFEALERDARLKPGSLAAAATAVRKGGCLIALGRVGDGEAAVQRGLPQLLKAGAAFRGDAVDAYHALGDAAFNRSEYLAARRHYEGALPLVAAEERLGTLSRLVKATAFDGGTASLDYANEGLRILAANVQPAKEAQAAFHTLRARTLLNLGRNDEAYEDLKTALRFSGGLTLKASLGDVSIRGDLALAAMLLGRKDDAKRYLAYTGQGRISETPFAIAEQMEAPECGVETGLKPDDFGVVEFAIGTDGGVVSAATVYSRGDQTTAAAFAQAVRGWTWNADSVAKIPPFYRASSRVELRCSTGNQGGRSALSPIVERFNTWAAGKVLLPRAAADNRAALLASLSQLIPQLASKGDAEREIAAIGLLHIESHRTDQNTVDQLDRAISLAGQAGTPSEVVNALRIFRTLASQRSRWALEPRRTKPSDGTRERSELLALATEPAIASDPVATATLRLLAARPGAATKQATASPDLVQQVADDARLGPTDPLRQYAVLTLANQAAEKGDLAGANALFQRTGLTEEQCALLGPVPALRRSGSGAEDYPMAALAYGFEGWVEIEFDISADGKAKGTRPLIAYPPFVFAEAATGMSRGFQFERTYRPSASVACSANSQKIRFVIPK